MDKTERRRFFRINDTLGVAYRVLTEEEVNSSGDQHNMPANVFSLLANYDTELNELLVQLKTKQPLLEQVVQALNKKINCVINHFEMESRLVERLAHKIRDVNISACGMAFVAEGDVSVGQSLSLDIVLQPSETHIFSLGKVVGCEKEKDGKGSYVRIDFYNMTNADQELLIQHIVQRQGIQRRTQRDSGQATPYL